MKPSAVFAAVAVFGLASSSLYASGEETLQRTRVARVKSAQANSFSAEVPVVARVQGTAFFRTAIDINNNTTQTVSVTFQFSYTCVSSSCNPPGGFYRTDFNAAAVNLSLPAIGNFHQDDIVDYLNTNALLQPGAEQGCIGTLLVTFSNLPTPNPNGSEGAVVARTYNHLDENTADSATVGFAYNASLFFESADTTLVGTARDTKAAPTVAGKLRSNVGVRNTDINNTTNAVSVALTFYDVKTGQLVATIPATDPRTANILPGELRQIPDVFTAAGIPSSVNQVIIFVDNPSPSMSSPTFEGYVTIIDGGGSILFNSTQPILTQDASFFEMKCADTNGCGN